MKNLNKKGITNIALFLGVSIITIILLVFLVVAIKGDNSIILGGNEKFKVTCDVSISDSVFGDPNIKQVVCNRGNNCLFAIQPLSIFSEKGAVKLLINDKVKSSKNYDIWQVVGDTTKTLSACTIESSGIIRLVDENNDLIDEQEVNW